MIGTDRLDKKILDLIGKKALYSSEISRRLGILRTTVQYRLGRLRIQGLTKKTTSGRKSFWQPIYKSTHNKSYFKMYKDQEVIQAYNQLLTLPPKTLVLCAQGDAAARNVFNTLPTLFIKEAHRVFKRKGIVMKGMFNEKSLNLFDSLDRDMTRSHIGRTLGLKGFSDDKFLSSGEIMSTDNFLLLSDPKSKSAIVIKDYGITKIVNDVLKVNFELLDEIKTFDLNDYLETKRRIAI